MLQRPHKLFSFPALLPTSIFVALAAALSAQEPVQYGRDIRPILADRCFRCHGPDAGAREAGLRLDRRLDAIAARDGGAAIVPGDPASSLVMQRVTAADPDDRMPPAHAQKPQLSDGEVQLLALWIQAGAKYEQHWAFAPLTQPVVPASGGSWAKNPFDHFVHHALAERGLSPSPEASAATVVRRAFLVVTGLPPTPEELDSYLADERPDAYEQLVHRLFNVEPYRSRHAEHLAQPWLDASRYADTCGIHMDAGRQIWPWRDWLLQSLADDKPFDDFVVEQIAGDLLPDATQSQRVATGFLRNHVTTDEGGAIDAEYLVEYAAERTATVGSVFLGLTLGCARCHDHKFDPISQEDYYGLFAFFYNNDEPGLYRQSKDINRALEPYLDVFSAEQTAERARLEAELETAKAELATEDPNEAASRAAFFADLQTESGIVWPAVTVVAAESTTNSTLVLQDDGSVLVEGENPPRDTHIITLRTESDNLRLLCLEALPDPSLGEGKVGRAPNGNAVLDYVRVETRPAGSREEWSEVQLIWAIADVEQQNGDYRVCNALADDDRGWAMASHEQAAGPRRALFLADAPFGEPAGTEVRVTLEYDSVYAQHALGRVRLHLGEIKPAMLERLPVAVSGFYTAGPFEADRDQLYDANNGPEESVRIDLKQRWGKTTWRFDKALQPDRLAKLANGTNATYVAHEIYTPTARPFDIALGSDDGFQVYVSGKKVAERRVNRGAAKDQDRIRFDAPQGIHAVVLKVVNTGGAGGFYWRSDPRKGELAGDMKFWLFPPAAIDAPLQQRIAAAWRERFSKTYGKRRTRVAAATKLLAERAANQPRTMVMKERDERRPTYMLMRGEYDKPDKSRVFTPALPVVFGRLPDATKADRLAFAQWLVSEENPLVHRVAVNRLVEFVFGTGIVRTSEDFGLQGEWPSNRNLLDWLAQEFRSNGTSMRSILQLLVTSKTFRQQSRIAQKAAALDGDNRLLAWFPRRRMTAEGIRDLALYAGGLLVERMGGPSVKPYQPAGLWREVAMPSSNTRIFKRDAGDALWRRSLYTYWKRAAPPPTLMTFDAPTREFCTIRRSITNTPLQALALWNDEQFVEAARALAERTLQKPGDDRAHLQSMYRRCTGHKLDAPRMTHALHLLGQLRRRYNAAPEDARSFLAVGESPRDNTIPAPEHAAFTLLANAFLNLDATLYID